MDHARCIRMQKTCRAEIEQAMLSERALVRVSKSQTVQKAGSFRVMPSFGAAGGREMAGVTIPNGLSGLWGRTRGELRTERSSAAAESGLRDSPPTQVNSRPRLANLCPAVNGFTRGD